MAIQLPPALDSDYRFRWFSSYWDFPLQIILLIKCIQNRAVQVTELIAACVLALLDRKPSFLERKSQLSM